MNVPTLKMVLTITAMPLVTYMPPKAVDAPAPEMSVQTFTQIGSSRTTRGSGVL